MGTNTTSIIGLLVATGLTASSSALGATILYQDDFSGPATSLDGFAPDVRPGTEVWKSANLNADGTVSATGHASYLPTSLATNTVYTLSVTSFVSYQSSGTAFQAFSGFTTTSPIDTGNMPVTTSGTGFILGMTRNGSWAFYPGPGNSTTAANGTGLFAASGNVEIDLVVTTSSTSNWTVAAYVNGNQLDLNGANPGLLHTVPLGNSFTVAGAITGVGLGYNSNTWRAEGFSFSAEPVPEPATAGLLAGVFAFAARRTRRS